VAPPEPDRQQIDVDYLAAWTDADADDAAYCDYERERDEWVRGNAPEIAGLGPVRQCLLVQPGRPESGVAFEELDFEGRICGALTQCPPACGIAGSPEPELPAIFLCEDRGAISFFTMMARTTTDIWGVRVDGLWTENGPDGWIIIPEPVPRSRLHLVETDQPIPRHR